MLWLVLYSSIQQTLDIYLFGFMLIQGIKLGRTIELLEDIDIADGWCKGDDRGARSQLLCRRIAECLRRRIAAEAREFVGGDRPMAIYNRLG